MGNQWPKRTSVFIFKNVCLNTVLNHLHSVLIKTRYCLWKISNVNTSIMCYIEWNSKLSLKSLTTSQYFSDCSNSWFDYTLWRQRCEYFSCSQDATFCSHCSLIIRLLQMIESLRIDHSLKQICQNGTSVSRGGHS